MFYETKIELMLRLASCFDISTVSEGLEAFTEEWEEHFKTEEEMEEFKTQVNEGIIGKGYTDVYEAIRYVRDCYPM